MARGRSGPGWAARCYDAFPVFRSVIDEVCDAGWLFSPDTDLDRTENTQFGLFAVEVGLFRLVESLGVTPEFLVGHSVGEIAAAHVAGVLSLADATRLVEARGRLMGELPAGGAMLAIEATEAEVAATLDDRVSLAAVNAQRAVVVSGDAEAVDALEARWSERRTRRLTVSHAFHSARMEPMLDEFRQVCAGLTFHPPAIPIASNVTGAIAGEELTDPEYWVRHVRGCVRFADDIAALREAGVTRFLELGPDAVLAGMARLALSDSDDSHRDRGAAQGPRRHRELRRVPGRRPHRRRRPSTGTPSTPGAAPAASTCPPTPSNTTTTG